VPALLVPFMADQPFWGRRVHALGVGPKPIPRRQLSVEKLAEGIRLMVTDEAMRRCAADLGARIRAEDRVGRAAELLEQHFYGGTHCTRGPGIWAARRSFVGERRSARTGEPTGVMSPGNACRS